MDETRKKLVQAFESYGKADAILAAIDAKVEARLAAMENLFRDLAWDNRHILVGGEDRAKLTLRELAPSMSSHQPTPKPSYLDGTICMARSPGGVACAAERNHDGPHNNRDLWWDDEPSPAPPGPSEAAINAVRDWDHDLPDPAINSYIRRLLRRAYAVDVPAIERAAAERVFAWLQTHTVDTLNALYDDPIDGTMVAELTERFLAEGGAR